MSRNISMSKIISFGKRLKQLRKYAKMTQPELAEKAGISKGQVSLLENEDRKIFQESFNKILTALGVSEEEFFAPFFISKENLEIKNRDEATSSIPKEIIDILTCDNETLKRELISYAQKLEERRAEIEERKEMKELLEELATEKRNRIDNTEKKTSDFPTADPERIDDELDGPEMGVWRF